MTKQIGFNKEDVERTYDFLRHEKETEIRLIDPRRIEPPKSIFVHSKEEFVKVCTEYNRKYNVYVGINERRPGGTKAEDVVAVRTTVFDIDSPHPKDEAATEEELELAKETAEKIAKDMMVEGATPALMMSGNGYQIWLKIPTIEITDENRERVETNLSELQKFIAQKYTGKCTIDNIGDLPRIIKVAGTMSVKGSNTPDRPWRLARWITTTEVPENAKLRESLLKPVPEKMKAQEIKMDVSITEILSKLNPKIGKLFGGDVSGYPSRSEAEMALVCELAKLKLSDQQIDMIMNQSSIGKWQEKGEGYKKLTIDKARQFDLEKKIDVVPKDLNEILNNIHAADDILKRELIPPVYLIDGLFREKSINIVGGESGTGKSWLVMDMAISIANGEKWGDQFQSEKKNVLYCDLEEDLYEDQRRLKLLEKTHQNTPTGLFIFTDGMLNLGVKNDLDTLKKVIQEKNIGVVFFDTGRRMHRFDENSADEVNQLYLDILKPLRDDLGVTIFYLMHTRKGMPGKWEEQPMDRLRGSGDFRGMANSIIFCEPIEKDSQLVSISILHGKMKGGIKRKPFKMDVIGPGSIESFGLVYGGEIEESMSRMNRICQEFLLALNAQMKNTFLTSDLKSWLKVNSIDKPRYTEFLRFMKTSIWIKPKEGEGSKVGRQQVYEIIYTTKDEGDNDKE